MWPAVLLVGGGLTRLSRDHPAAAAVVAAVAVPAAGLVIVASPAKVPLVGSSGRHDPGPARTVYVTPPVPRVTVTATPEPSSSPTPPPSPTPSGSGTPTPPVPTPDADSTGGGSDSDGGGSTPEPDPEPPTSQPEQPEPDPEPPAPPAETPAHAYGVCVAGLHVPLPGHVPVQVRVLCRADYGRKRAHRPH